MSVVRATGEAGSSHGRVGRGPQAAHDPALLRIPAIIYSCQHGVEGAFDYISPQVEEILGFAPEEWYADPSLWYARVHPDDREWVGGEEQEDPLTADGDSAIEYRMIHRDGHVVWLRDDAQLVHGSEGVDRWHGVVSDITQQKQTELQLERAAAQHAAVAALGEHALEGASSAALAHEAVTAAVQLLGVEIGGVIELSPDRRRFTFLASHGIPVELAAAAIPFDPETQPGYAINNGRVIVSDWATETRFRRTDPVVDGDARSGMSILIEGRRRPFGVLGAHCTKPREFSKMDVDFVQALANVLGDAFERQRTEDAIRHRALHDPLTGLPNRTLFMDRLGHALQHLRRRESRAAVLFLDLDRFKLVNESLGHEVGDELLAAAAPRMKQTVRASDTVARFGADEFAILLEDIRGERDAVEMAQRIAGVFTRPFVLEGDEHFVTTSIGISLAAAGERAEDLVRDAEAAMHRAKERGRARYELFDEGIRGRALSRLRVENDLRRALERDEFTLEFQPIIGLRPRAITGVEALIRWDHPLRGRVPPLDFIPIAEENGLIEPIGQWVLEHASRQAARWCAARPDARPIAVGVNLSAAQLANPALPEIVAAALRGAKLDASLLALELTETVMMEQSEHLFETLAALKAIGVKLVLDDFGTGYSSLSYLTRLPLDVLKVDRSFIDGLGSEQRDTGITEAIIAMSRALSLSVIGEGVENERQLAELDRLGCHAAQGFYFSRPVPPERIVELLEAGSVPIARAS